MGLRFFKNQYPALCNSCARTAEYIIAAGIHTIKLCGPCARELKQLIVVAESQSKEYNNSEETGLVIMRRIK